MPLDCPSFAPDAFTTLQEMRWTYARMLNFIQARLNDIDQQLQALPDDEMVLTNGDES